MNFLTLLIICALLATIGAFAAGMISMVQGGQFDQEHSTQFMWARVGLQGAAVVLMLLALLVAAF